MEDREEAIAFAVALDVLETKGGKPVHPYPCCVCVSHVTMSFVRTNAHGVGERAEAGTKPEIQMYLAESELIPSSCQYTCRRSALRTPFADAARGRVSGSSWIARGPLYGS